MNRENHPAKDKVILRFIRAAEVEGSVSEANVKVDKDCKFQLIFERVCKHLGIANPRTVTFSFDGTIINELTHTPRSLGIQDEEQIDMIEMQAGGGRASELIN
jgi:hypothetical protein